MTKPNLSALEEKIGVFDNKDLLVQALTHRSYVNENRSAKEHNERLEFLGDAVLELIITDYLYRAYPATTEGDLTLYRSALVNTQNLSQVANEIEVNGHLLLSRGEAKDTGRARDHILANTIEAIIGALYMDGGFEKAKKFVDKYIAPKIKKVIENGTWMDAKSKFQEKAQEVMGITPSYQTIKEEGPDHAKTFTVAVYVGEKMIAEGGGKSKQDAEQVAARNGLEKEGWL